MTLLKSCCFCIPLRGGVIALCSTLLLFQTFGIVSGLVNMCNAIRGKYDDWNIAEIAIFLFLNFVSAIASICAIVGAIKMNKKLLVPHLVLEGITIIGLVILILVYIILFGMGEIKVDDKPIRPHIFYIMMGLGLTILLLGIYLWICVKSLYEKLKEHDGKTVLPHIVHNKNYRI